MVLPFYSRTDPALVILPGGYCEEQKVDALQDEEAKGSCSTIIFLLIAQEKSDPCGPGRRK